jgi:hypothetical protein
LSNYESHAWLEFKASGWVDENNKFNDEMQEAICNHVLKLLKVFEGEGHSGSSAPYAINLFKKLAMFEPVAPLTGEDWEWADVSEYGVHTDGPLYQNKRCSHVFKDRNGAYDINGIVWYDWHPDKETGTWHKNYFTNYKSRVAVTFPYTPKTEHKEWVEE